MENTILKFEPGCFFMTHDGLIWRLESMDSKRVAARRLQGAQLMETVSMVNDFTCTLVEHETIIVKVLDTILRNSFNVDQGSVDSEIHDDDNFGGSTKTASVIVTKEKFRKVFVAPVESTKAIGAMWGDEILVRYFCGLDTLGGFYDAKWEDFDHPDDTFFSPPLMARGFVQDGEGSICGRDDSGAGDYGEDYAGATVKGAVPDFTAYHDESEASVIIPLLREITDPRLLQVISKKARHPQIRLAADRVLHEDVNGQLVLFSGPLLLVSQ